MTGMPPTHTAWYRLELDEKGKVLSCRVVDGPGKPGRRVQYVEAASQKDAERLAYNRWSHDLLLERRARYKREGLCRCGSKRDVKGSDYCARCQKLRTESKERSELRKTGVHVPSPDRREVLRERRASEDDAVRLEVFRACLARYQADPRSFGSWAKARIAELEGARS